MIFLLEFNSFYKEGDIVIIEYWYNSMLTPVRLVEKISKNKFKITHNLKESNIPNAPDEIIKSSDILDIYRIR